MGVSKSRQILFIYIASFLTPKTYNAQRPMIGKAVESSIDIFARRDLRIDPVLFWRAHERACHASLLLFIPPTRVPHTTNFRVRSKSLEIVVLD
jgi:hypothetical protein